MKETCGEIRAVCYCRDTRSLGVVREEGTAEATMVVRAARAIVNNPKKVAELVDLANLSGPLREFMGQSQVSRLGCFVRVWSYIKEKGLQVCGIRRELYALDWWREKRNGGRIQDACGGRVVRAGINYKNDYLRIIPNYICYIRVRGFSNKQYLWRLIYCGWLAH